MFDNQTRWRIEELIKVIRDGKLAEREDAAQELADKVEEYIRECDEEKE